MRARCGRLLVATLIALATLPNSGCSESRPPLKIAEPLSPAEERRWQELWKQGPGPPAAERDDIVGDAR